MSNILDSHVTIYEGQNPYDYDNNIILNWYPQRIIELTKNAESIMELGLGHGFTAQIFAKHFQRHVVLEGSPSVIENFEKHFPNCQPEIVETYFEKFQSDEKFDVIVMGFVLEHVDDPLEIITHFKNFLAPGGKMFIAVPNAEALNRRLGHYAGLLPDLQMLSENDIISGHKRYYTVKSLTEEARGAGYEIELIEGIYLKPFTTKQMMSLNFEKNIVDALCKAGVEYPELSLGILVMLK
jgi:2-polyprenyl-3-methyl-5-hydroxy-6-metoxy-1,4-benzoquinol methylase